MVVGFKQFGINVLDKQLLGRLATEVAGAAVMRADRLPPINWNRICSFVHPMDSDKGQ